MCSAAREGVRGCSKRLVGCCAVHPAEGLHYTTPPAFTEHPTAPGGMRAAAHAGQNMLYFGCQLDPVRLSER